MSTPFDTPQAPSATRRGAPIDWHLDALCVQIDPELFFPEKGRATDARRARGICAQCPVARICFDEAMYEESKPGVVRFGIRGGATARERKLIATGRRPAPDLDAPSEEVDVLDRAG